MSTQEEHVLKILIATDNHLGVWENDDVRKHDSFVTFEEIFEIAGAHNVDMVLLGGDLFHDNKPSRHTVVRAMDILSRHCLNDRPVSFQILSDQSQNFTTGRVNFQNPNYSVGLPVFTIHGNHDDPAGANSLSAVDILATGALVNYFGKAAIMGEISGEVFIRPILMCKGETKLALYGLGNIRDERLCRLFSIPEGVKWIQPESTQAIDKEDWFNVFVLHQNRVSHAQAAKNVVREKHLASFIDLVIWGHEHECLADPWESIEGDGRFSVMQPGSSVATALSEGESKRKHVVMLEVLGHQWRTSKLPLETVRPFVFESVALAGQKGVNPEDPETITTFLAGKLTSMIDAAVRGRGPRTPELPLVRLRVDYTGFSTINTQRFGQRFVGKVANPHDIVLWHKAPTRRPKGAEAGLPGVATRPETLDEARIEDLIAEHLRQNLEILPEVELTGALREYVDKDDKDALITTVATALQETQAAVEGGIKNFDAAAAGTIEGTHDGRANGKPPTEEKALESAIENAAKKRKVDATVQATMRRAAEVTTDTVADRNQPTRGAIRTEASASRMAQPTPTMDEGFADDDGLHPFGDVAATQARGKGGGSRAKAPALPKAAPKPRGRRAAGVSNPKTTAPRQTGARAAAAAARQRLNAIREEVDDRSGDEDFQEQADAHGGDDDDVIETISDDEEDDVRLTHEEAAAFMEASYGGKKSQTGLVAVANRRRGKQPAGGRTVVSLVDSDGDDDEGAGRPPVGGSMARQAPPQSRTQMTFGRFGGGSEQHPLQDEEVSPWDVPPRAPDLQQGPMPQGLPGIYFLAVQGRWQEVASKCRELLPSQPSLELHALHILALTKLKAWQEVAIQFSAVSEQETEWPWALHWLNAELPAALGNPAETIDRFYSLLDKSRKSLEDISASNEPRSAEFSKWTRRKRCCAFTLVTRHTAAGKIKAALALLDQILAENPDDAQAWSQAARVCTYAGELTAAQACLTAGKAAAEKTSNTAESKAALVDLGKDSASMMLLLEKPLEALRAFESLSRRGSSMDCQGRDPELASNKALCHAYAGSLSGARRQLDAEFSEEPLRMLHEAIVGNVATLYDVVPPCEDGVVGMAKRKLRAWVAAAAPDDFDLTCAKMGPAGSV